MSTTTREWDNRLDRLATVLERAIGNSVGEDVAIAISAYVSEVVYADRVLESAMATTGSRDDGEQLDELARAEADVDEGRVALSRMRMRLAELRLERVVDRLREIIDEVTDEGSR